MIHVPIAVAAVFAAFWLVSFLYACAALWRIATVRLPHGASGSVLPTMSVLKPLYGLEPELEENLATFCEQDYPSYEVFFAVRDPADPAAEIARRVIEAHPSCTASVVTGGGAQLRNPKIANLSAALPSTKGEIIVIADSDMRANREYLRGVAAPFADERVGAVTAIYAARSIGSLASWLGAMYVNEQFVPSVLVATLLQPLRFAFGATMAVRRSVLTEIGGVTAIGGTIADDYTLGRLVSAHGYRVALAGTIPQTLISETSVRDLLTREIRWARTIRSVRPAGYVGSVVTFPLVFAVFDLLFLPGVMLGAALLIASLTARVALDVLAHRMLRVPDQARPWLVPLRELLSLVVWAAGLFGSGALWRRRNLAVTNKGS